jgi:hypothetical protein
MTPVLLLRISRSISGTLEGDHGAKAQLGL